MELKVLIEEAKDFLAKHGLEVDCHVKVDNETYHPAVYNKQKQLILLKPIRANRVILTSLLIHELIHCYQFKHGKWVIPTAEIPAIVSKSLRHEYEAYLLQFRYISEKAGVGKAKELWLMSTQKWLYDKPVEYLLLRRAVYQNL